MEELEKVIRENTGWLLGWMHARTGNRQTAEDLVQEVWMRVFRAWDGYREDGRLRAWLGRIARNVYYSHMAEDGPWVCLSLDVWDEDEDPLSDILTDGVTAEDRVLEMALTEDVMRALSRLPKQQKQVITFRYLLDMTIPEVAQKLDMAPGTVKSNTHYGLSALRKQLGADTEQQKGKGEKHMECREAMQYLFVYAKGILKENRQKVEEHLKTCEACRNMADALGKLVPHLPEDQEGISHYIVHFPEQKVMYVGLGAPLENTDSQNARLREWKGVIPENESWLDGGFGQVCVLDRIFDNEGNEIRFRIYQRTENHYRVQASYLKQMYPYMWQHMVCHEWDNGCPDTVWQDKDDTTLYHGRASNGFGTEVKSAVYQMIPSESKNIRIRKGSGVIDCGRYKAAYAERYLGADESILLEYTFRK